MPHSWPHIHPPGTAMRGAPRGSAPRSAGSGEAAPGQARGMAPATGPLGLPLGPAPSRGAVLGPALSLPPPQSQRPTAQLCRGGGCGTPQPFMGTKTFALVLSPAPGCPVPPAVPHGALGSPPAPVQEVPPRSHPSPHSPLLAPRLSPGPAGQEGGWGQAPLGRRWGRKQQVGNPLRQDCSCSSRPARFVFIHKLDKQPRSPQIPPTCKHHAIRTMPRVPGTYLQTEVKHAGKDQPQI